MNCTWTLKVCKNMASCSLLRGLGQISGILWRSRYGEYTKYSPRLLNWRVLHELSRCKHRVRRRLVASFMRVRVNRPYTKPSSHVRAHNHATDSLSYICTRTHIDREREPHSHQVLASATNDVRNPAYLSRAKNRTAL